MANVKSAQEAITKIIDLKNRGHVALALQNFQEELNKPAPKSWTKEKDLGSGRKVRYLPISYIEALLDAYFLGSWTTNGFTYMQVGNQIVGSLELCVSNPITGLEVCRTGGAAVMIGKTANSLEGNFPHLISDCLSNAAKKLGRRFGRDLGRNVDATAPVMAPAISEESILDDIVNEQNETAA